MTAIQAAPVGPTSSTSRSRRKWPSAASVSALVLLSRSRCSAARASSSGRAVAPPRWRRTGFGGLAGGCAVAPRSMLAAGRRVVLRVGASVDLLILILACEARPGADQSDH